MASNTDELTQPRVKDAASARAIWKRYDENDRARVAQMASVRNQIDGGRPFDPATLAKNGESWMTNVNFRDAEASFNRTYLPYWKMVHDVPNKIATSLDINSPYKDRWAKAVSECFDLFLEDWGADYFFNFMLFTNDFVKFGPGYVTWPDGDKASPSPRFKHARTEYVKLPKRAKANIADWEICAVEGEMTVSELWTKIRSDKAAKRAKYVGWNTDMVKKAIAFCMKGDAVQSDLEYSNWTAIQDRIVSNDLAASEEGSPLPIIRMFVRGWDGKIAYYVFSKTGIVPEFLCSIDDYADNMKQAIGGLFYDVGTGGLVHSIKGYGIKNYYFSILQNRMKSRTMDAATFAMSFNFQRDDDGGGESPPVENYGAVNIFPRNLRQIPVYPQIGVALQVTDALTRNQQENNYIYRDSSRDIAETQTARQAVILANLSEEIGSATASIYLAQVGENVFSETVRRLLKPGSRDPDAVKFKKRLVARGVPQKVIGTLSDVITVKTGASPGTAGAALRDMILKELLGMIRLPGMNVRYILENYVANKLGTQAVDKVLLPEGAESAPAQRREAMIENSLFGQGMDLPVDPSDAHLEHAEEHIKPLGMIIAAYKAKGQLAPEQLVALSSAIPHTQQHFELLRQDETMAEDYKRLFPVFSQIQSIAAGIFTNLMKQQQARARQGMQPGQDMMPAGASGDMGMNGGEAMMAGGGMEDGGAPMAGMNGGM